MPHHKHTPAHVHRPHPFPLATALLSSLKTYNRQTLRADIIAGLIVSLITLPLAMALSIAVGLPQLSWPDFIVGGVTLLGLIFTPRIAPKIPAAVAGITMGFAAAWLLQHFGMAVDTLFSRFSYTAACSRASRPMRRSCICQVTASFSTSPAMPNSKAF